MGVPLYVTSFSLAAFKILSWSLTFDSYNVFCCGSVYTQTIWDALDLIDLDVHFSPQVWEVFSHTCFKHTLPLSCSLLLKFP